MQSHPFSDCECNYVSKLLAVFIKHSNDFAQSGANFKHDILIQSVTITEPDEFCYSDFFSKSGTDRKSIDNHIADCIIDAVCNGELYDVLIAGSDSLTNGYVFCRTHCKQFYYADANSVFQHDKFI